MLTPKENSLLPEAQRRFEPATLYHAGQRARLSYSGPQFKDRLVGGRSRVRIPLAPGFCRGRVIPVTSKLALQWLPCQAPGVIGSALGLVGPVSVYCNWVRWKVRSATSISVRQHVKLSEQIRPWDTLACCWDVKQPTKKQTPIQRRDSGFLQFPHCSANCLQRVRSSGPDAIVCKARATHRALTRCNMCATWYEGTALLLTLFSRDP